MSDPAERSAGGVSLPPPSAAAPTLRVRGRFVTAVDAVGASVPRTPGSPFQSRRQCQTVMRCELSDEAFKRRVSMAKEGKARLQVVRAAPLPVLGNDYKAPVHAKTREEIDFIGGCLRESFLFDKLGSNEKRTLVDAFEKHTVESGQTIIRQGEVGDYFYVIHKGEVKYEVGRTKEGKAGRGSTFGELALLYNCPRAATVTALTACELWRVDQITFRRIMTTYQIRGDAQTKELLEKVEFLKDLDDSTLTKIAYVMKTWSFKAGEQIFHKGKKDGRFLLVKSGKLKATDIEIGGKKMGDKEFGPGDHVGGIYVLKGIEITPANLVAVEDATVLHLESSDFIRTCGCYNELIRQSGDKVALEVMPIANRRLDKSTAGHLASMTVGMDCKAGHVLYREGDDIEPGVFLVHSGKVKLESSDGSCKTLGVPAVFGEETVNETLEGTVTSKYTVTVTQDACLSYLGARSIKSVLGSKDPSRNEIKMEDLEKHRILGAGTFGQVWLVSKKGTKDVYALKAQFKRQLIDSKQVNGVIREKNIMAKLNSNFIIKLLNTSQDDHNVYMVMKLYQGGELWSIMHGDEDYDALPEWVARFYAGNVLEGLAHMHHNNVVYRDLKPENVLLDSDGYTVIVDLGLAKVVPDKTYTFCGTPPYMAPEVILQRGHHKGADHWSWGIMLYEMLCGITPFYDMGIDQLTLYKRIIDGNYRFPDGDFLSEEAKDLIKNLLVADPVDRLGGFAGAEKDIQEHAWFHDLDFEKLHNKELTPPWQPEIADPLDASNFNNWDHLEDNKQEGEPLSVEEQSLFKDF